MQDQAADLAAELAALSDALLPGNDRFPSATAVGAHGVAADRIRARVGTEGLSQLIAALAAAGGPLAGAADRPAVVARLQRDHPALFGTVQLALYTAYYESPAVIAAIRGLGLDYNDAPQPQGYQLPPFDAADPLSAPGHRRGFHRATEAVTRVDLSTLPADPLAPEDYTAAAGAATGRGLLSTGTRKDAGAR